MALYTLTSKNFPPLAGVHAGTGSIRNAAHAVVPSSVDQDIAVPLDFQFKTFAISVLSLEIDTQETPNWFGVGFRQDIQSFDTVNIFCHPHPGHAGMADADYPSRSGNWPKLFRYVQNLTRQMDMARKDFIIVVPFLTNADYGSTGIFGPNWKDLVEQILVMVRNQAAGMATTPGKARSAYVPSSACNSRR